MTEVRLGVAIPVTDSEPEIELAINPAEHGTTSDSGTSPQSHIAQSSIRGPPAVGVLDDDVRGSRHQSGRGDTTSGNRTHDAWRIGLIFESAVSGAVPTRRSSEVVDDLAGDGRPPARRCFSDSPQTEREQ